LAPGVGREQAQAAFTAMAQALEQAYPKENSSLGQPAFVIPLYGFGSIRERNSQPQFLIGMAAPFVVMGLLLAIACANVAGVMLARGASRQREIAIRLALGASRRRVVHMLLADSLLLSLAGAAGGLLLTAWAAPLISRVQLPNTPPLPVFSLELDGRMGLYTLAIALATCLFCGLLPARQATRPQLLPSLKQTALQGARAGRLRRMLVTGQVAASTLLLVICLLFLRSLWFIGGIDPGFAIDRGITARVTPERRNPTTEQTHALAEELAHRVGSLPGVESASFANLIPLGGDSVGGWTELKDRPDYRGPMILYGNVGPHYFRTMGIRVIRGREFEAADRAGTAPVAVVNETFARQAFPNGDAVGRLVRQETREGAPWREIVGVVADNKYAFYAEPPRPQLFAPFLQTGGRIFLQVRTAGAPSRSLAIVRRAIQEAQPSLMADVRTTRDAASLEFGLRRLSTGLLAGMGGLGLLLAMIGLYGVLSWEVSRRTAEIGIRMALGASGGMVRLLVLKNTLMLSGGGIAVGVGLAMLATLPLRSFLAGVSGTDPLTMATVAAVLSMISVAASWLPARRATRIDPIAALRCE
jgi:predicted permease